MTRWYMILGVQGGREEQTSMSFFIKNEGAWTATVEQDERASPENPQAEFAGKQFFRNGRKLN